MAEIKLKIASVVIGSGDGGGSGVAPYYADLPDKPSINGETLSGDMTSEDLGLASSEQSVPAGGTTGQVLAKKSNADNDVQWVNQESGEQGTTDYADLENKPKINNVTLSGNKTAAQLGLQAELVSGTNIKTINNQSIVGSGNISIESGTKVEANPTGEATETLGKIKIGVTTYKTDNPFVGEVQVTDAQRLQALANISNQEAGYDESDPPVFTGKMGYVVLQPETDDKTTFAAQIANKPNTIFEIRDVFNIANIDSNPIEIPNNCVLYFNGGTLIGGINNPTTQGQIKIGDNTVIKNGKFKAINNYGSYPLVILDGENIKLTNCDFIQQDDKYDVKYIDIKEDCKNVHISDCTFDGHASICIHVCGEGTVIERCNFASTVRPEGTYSYTNAIKLSAESATDDHSLCSRNTIIRDCWFGSFTDNPIDCFAGAMGLTIQNCIFEHEGSNPCIEIKNSFQTSNPTAGTSIPGIRCCKNIIIDSCIFNSLRSITISYSKESGYEGDVEDVSNILIRNCTFKISKIGNNYTASQIGISPTGVVGVVFDNIHFGEFDGIFANLTVGNCKIINSCVPTCKMIGENFEIEDCLFKYAIMQGDYCKIINSKFIGTGELGCITNICSELHINGVTIDSDNVRFLVNHLIDNAKCYISNSYCKNLIKGDNTTTTHPAYYTGEYYLDNCHYTTTKITANNAITIKLDNSFKAGESYIPFASIGTSIESINNSLDASVKELKDSVGTNYSESKILAITSGENKNTKDRCYVAVNTTSGHTSGDLVVMTGSLFFYCCSINVENATKVVFLGTKKIAQGTSTTPNYYTGYAFYDALPENLEYGDSHASSNLIGSVHQWPTPAVTTAETIEITEYVPAGAKSLCVTLPTGNYGGVSPDNFYCYVMYGDSVSEIISMAGLIYITNGANFSITKEDSVLPNMGIISYGSGFSVTLNADTGYSIDSISVKMGGKDISDDVVTANSITIAKCTGHIEITVETSSNP